MKGHANAIGCFGKVPSSGDFVRGHANPAVVAMLDEWLAQTMRLLSAEPRWKMHYDALGPLSFALAGTKRRHAIAGHIDLSRDQAGRRYPLLLMSAIEVEPGIRFLGSSPIALQPAWRRLAAIADELQTGADAQAILNRSSALSPEALPDSGAADSMLSDFAAGQTLAGLDRSLSQAGHSESVRNLLLALGTLMRPVAASGCEALESALRLPLPAQAEGPVAAAFFLSLIAPFTRHGDFELALLLPHARNEMLIGFSGASPHLLHALIDPQAAAECVIGLDDCSWLGSEIERSPPLYRLACMLDQPQLTLAGAKHQFEATFLGE